MWWFSGLFQNVFARSSSLCSRSLHVTAACCKVRPLIPLSAAWCSLLKLRNCHYSDFRRFSVQNRAARVRVGKGDKPLTYEQAHPPHQIAHRKGWLSQHCSESSSSEAESERVAKRFMWNTSEWIKGTQLTNRKKDKNNISMVVSSDRRGNTLFGFYYKNTKDWNLQIRGNKKNFLCRQEQKL